MILSKSDLHEYLRRDMAFFRSYSRREQFMCRLLQDPAYLIAKYVEYLRKEEYFFNTGKKRLHTLLYLYYLRKKNIIGNKLGFKIPKNCFGAGLQIFHHGEIIVNEDARIGEDCILHGGNCIGNSGKVNDVPVIGNGLDLGIGAKIIGNVQLGDNVTVGANAVVTKSFKENEVTLVGIPACVLVRE